MRREDRTYVSAASQNLTNESPGGDTCHASSILKLAVDDAARARAFYEQTLGWKIVQWGDQDYWMVTTVSRARSALMARSPRAGRTGRRSSISLMWHHWRKPSAAVKTNGGKVVEGPMPIPGVGYLAYCLDTEGNAFGLNAGRHERCTDVRPDRRVQSRSVQPALCRVCGRPLQLRSILCVR